ncbi:MAG: peptidase M48, partial [Pseudomonadota bacterium]
TPVAGYRGGVYNDGRGHPPPAALATAERYAMMGDHNLALRSADVAVQGLKPGTVDYLRAQDIAMTSRAAVEQQRKKR